MKVCSIGIAIEGRDLIVAVDQELSAKLESELQMEKEMRDSEKLPVTVQDYLDNSSFEVGFHHIFRDIDTKLSQLHDTPGNEEVILTRQFGDESCVLTQESPTGYYSTEPY